MPVDRVKELVQEGLRRRLSGDLTGAVEAWAEVLQLDPENARAREGLIELKAAGVPIPAAVEAAGRFTPAAGLTPGQAPQDVSSTAKKNPFARPESARYRLTPSPFSAIPSNATPLSMVVPPDVAAREAARRAEQAAVQSEPHASTPVFGMPATSRDQVAGPPGRFDPFGDASAGAAARSETGRTLVFGGGEESAPPSAASPAAPAGGPVGSSQTMVFGLNVGAPPPPAAPASAPGPSQTMVFGSSPSSPAMPAVPEPTPAPTPGQTMVFGIPKPAGMDLPFGSASAPAPSRAALNVASRALESLSAASGPPVPAAGSRIPDPQPLPAVAAPPTSAPVSGSSPFAPPPPARSNWNNPFAPPPPSDNQSPTPWSDSFPSLAPPPASSPTVAPSSPAQQSPAPWNDAFPAPPSPPAGSPFVASPPRSPLPASGLSPARLNPFAPPPGLRPALTPPTGFSFPVESPGTTPVPRPRVVMESEDEEISIEESTPTPASMPRPAPPSPAVAAPSMPSPVAAVPTESIDPGELLLRAIDLLDLDDYSGAMKAVDRVLAMDPTNATAQELKARCEVTLLAMYESKLGDLTRRPSVRLKPDEMVWLNLDHRAGFLLSMIDGQVSFEDVFALSSMSRLETAKILLDLVQEKVIG